MQVLAVFLDQAYFWHLLPCNRRINTNICDTEIQPCSPAAFHRSSFTFLTLPSGFTPLSSACRERNLKVHHQLWPGTTTGLETVLQDSWAYSGPLKPGQHLPLPAAPTMAQASVKIMDLWWAESKKTHLVAFPSSLKTFYFRSSLERSTPWKCRAVVTAEATHLLGSSIGRRSWPSSQQANSPCLDSVKWMMPHLAKFTLWKGGRCTFMHCVVASLCISASSKAQNIISEGRSASNNKARHERKRKICMQVFWYLAPPD